MAHFTFTRTGGVWVTAPPNPLLATEVADLDLKTYKSINGDDGGSWAPAAAIAIGGAGLALGGSNHQVLSGGAVVWLNGSLLQVNASGAATFLCTVALDGGATVASAHSLTMSSGSTFTASAGSNFGVQTGCHASISLDSSSTLYVGAGATFTVHVDADAVIALGATASLALSGGAPLTVGSGCTATIAAGATFAIGDATVTLAGVVTPSGKGRVRCRPVIGADANATYNVADYDLVHVESNSAARTYTLGNTGAATGDRIRFSSRDTVYGIDIQINGGGTDVTIKGGVIETVDYTYIGSAWYRTGTDKI